MTNRLHAAPEYRLVLAAILRQHLPVVELWAHGSRVYGRRHDGSGFNLVLRGPGLKGIRASRLAFYSVTYACNCQIIL